MAKIYKFPTGEEITPDIDPITATSDECVEISQYLMEVLEEFITTGQASDDKRFMDMNFRDESIQESRDMFVIVNMINAMLNRYMGIPHRLHRTFDRAYVEIKALLHANEKGREELEKLLDQLEDEDNDTT